MVEKPTFEEIVAQYERAMVIVAHPDDPEFFTGGTVGRLTGAGIQVEYLIVTAGDKGNDDRSITGPQLATIRVVEQEAAAKCLGVTKVTFLGYPDGFLEPSYEVQRDVVRELRRFRPDIVLTTDPDRLYSTRGISHRDHRTAGLIVLDSVFPAARNHMYFPELMEEGWEPHKVREIWISRGSEPDLEVNTTSVYEQRIEALLNHRTQIGDPERFIQRMSRRRETEDGPVYERFHRIVFR